ncbi:hypothetical protein Dsin_014420 [Dipteronia sinensis]|uniref:DUF4220 domain-containing protein n=1 Tax=Dipteronia sinensis TaxID=43782 RepID=A0AAE0EBJ5_9ROSI|nr:hypothetical protein Dsin_014420 [Dipteronia sinensis]
MEIFPETLKKQWNLWEIRSLVLLSLSLQIILIMFGSRRKINNPQSFIGIILNAIVWCAYISADWVATVALSVMASNEADCEHASSKARDSLQAFWAPFLLLHLGGPDTITAYSLEDNELWLRHFLGLVIEVGVAFYVFVRFWSSNSLTFLSIPMFITGIVKYGERTWVLWSSNTQRFKNSLDPLISGYAPFPDLFNYKFTSNKLVVQEGINPDDHILIEAYYSYKRLKYLFANQIIDEYHYNSYDIINGKSAEDAFKLVAIELGFIYDVLYTKAAIVYSRIGISLRCISSISSVSALVLFSIIIDMQSYSLIDIMVTYLLLVGAVLLEIYAFILLFYSDWTRLWLVKFKVAKHYHMSKTLVDNFWRFTNCLHSRLSNNKRWSESMGQYNLMSSVFGTKQRRYLGLEKLSCTSELCEFSEKYQYLTWEDVNISLQETIFKYLKERADELQQTLQPFLQSFQKTRDKLLSRSGEDVLRRYGYDHLLVDEEYDARIIIWHIVTDKYYRYDLNNVQGNANKLNQDCKISKWLSDYMLYLLLFCPSMLPKGIGEIRYEHTYVDATIKLPPSEQRCKVNKELKSNICPRSVFERARGLASQLKGDENGWEKRWEMIREVWLEMLAYAAQNCEWIEHAQHLMKGGELLTHVGVLMVNFGLNKQVVFKAYS